MGPALFLSSFSSHPSFLYYHRIVDTCGKVIVFTPLISVLNSRSMEPFSLIVQLLQKIYVHYLVVVTERLVCQVQVFVERSSYLFVCYPTINFDDILMQPSLLVGY